MDTTLNTTQWFVQFMDTMSFQCLTLHCTSECCISMQHYQIIKSFRHNPKIHSTADCIVTAVRQGKYLIKQVHSFCNARNTCITKFYSVSSILSVMHIFRHKKHLKIKFYLYLQTINFYPVWRNNRYVIKDTCKKILELLFILLWNFPVLGKTN